MRARSLLAVAIATIGVWFIGNTLAMLLANAIGELSYAAIGVLIIILACGIGVTSDT